MDQVGHRWSHGCQGEMDVGCAVREGHGGAAGSSCGQLGQSCSVLLGIQLPLAAAHSSDEGSSLTAAVLRQQEVDITFGGEFLHSLLEDPRKTEEKRARGNCGYEAACY